MPILQSEITLSQRLKIFIELCYQTQKGFSVRTEIDPNTLSRYIKNKICPSLESFLKFQEGGLSIDWLISGQGEMFASNPQGKKLSQINSLNTLTKNKEIIKQRILRWIEEFQGGLEKFAIESGYNLTKMKRILYEIDLIEPKFLVVLDDFGCSIEWLKTGEGDPFKGFNIGRQKAYQYNKTDENNSISNILKIPEDKNRFDSNNNAVNEK